MKLIIDIPENIRVAINQMGLLRIPDEMIKVVDKAIQHSIPLPKGHGRLIDADELKKHKYHDRNRFENAVAVAYIDWADTIIETDTGETE